jgi:hypothetical protein
MPSVGEASSSIRHGHGRVKDTHAAGLALRSAATLGVSHRGSEGVGEASVSRAWGSTRVTQARKPVLAHRRRGL